MALLHHATLVASKSDLLEAWLPSRPWAPTGPIVVVVRRVGADPGSAETLTATWAGLRDAVVAGTELA